MCIRDSYERYVVINPGVAAEAGVEKRQTLSEKEYLDILATLPKGNQALDDAPFFRCRSGVLLRNS